MIYDRRKSGLWAPRHGAPAIIPAALREAWAFRARQGAAAASAAAGDPYWASVILLITGNIAYGATPVSDQSNHATLTWSSAMVDAGFSAWPAYGSSIDHNSGSINCAGSTTSFSGDFFVDGWIRTTAGSTVLQGIWQTDTIFSGAGTGLELRLQVVGGNYKLQWLTTGGSGIGTGSTTLSASTSYYYQIGRTGTTLNMWVGGTLQYTGTVTSTFTLSATRFVVGGEEDVTPPVVNPFVGYTWDHRFTLAYRSNIAGTVPTSPPPTY